jgi:hypothetical protein
MSPSGPHRLRTATGRAAVSIFSIGLVVLFSTRVAAQSQQWREAPIIEPAEATAAAAAPKPVPPPSADAVVQVYLDGCVLHEGRSAAVIDWALAQGFEPLDPLRTGAEDLLGGAAGAVLAAPGSGERVLLAAGDDRRCVVWAENTHGPGLRSAFQKMVSALGFKGARVQGVIDRNLNSGGAWRNQSQWRYRRVGGSEDFSLGSATTLGGAASAQLLHFAPMASAAPPAVAPAVVAPRQPGGAPSR